MRDDLERLADRLDHLDGHDGEERDEIDMIAAELRTLAQQSAAPVVPDGWQLMPLEVTPEMMSAAAVAVWPVASPADVAKAREAAKLVLMQMDLSHGMTVDMVSASIATMVPAWREMVKAAPKPEGAVHG